MSKFKKEVFEPKKIVIDARESGTSTGRYIDKLIEHLHKLKPRHNIVIITKKHRIDFMQTIAPTFEVIQTNCNEFTFAEQLQFNTELKNLQADLVHFGMVQQPVLYPGKVVTTMHDLTTTRFRNPSKNWFVFTLKQQLYKWVNKKVAKKSMHIITPSEFVRKDVANFCRVPLKKITTTLEAADKINAAPEPVPELVGKQFILFVGRPAAHKNLNCLVDAFAILKKQHPKLRLVFTGKLNADYEKLRAYARQKTKDVIFTDFASEGELRWLYEHTAVYAFPSLSEGFGLPSLEAMMNGPAPVASSNATCLPEINQDAALYFDPHNIKEITKTINTILTDKKVADRLRTSAAKVARSYSWKRMAEQTLDIYERVLRD